MGTAELQTMIGPGERMLAGIDQSERSEATFQELLQVIKTLLNVVETLRADNQSLAAQLERQRFGRNKQPKTTASSRDDQPTSPPSDPTSPPSDPTSQPSDHSSEKRRRKLQGKAPRKGSDRRTFKDLTIHETIECLVDPATLPPDAVRWTDEIVMVQGIIIEPRNIRCQRQVFHSLAEGRFYRAPLPLGCDQGAYHADLRALIVSLKYCGNMSEPKIRELLGNFDVQVSAGSVSKILTDSASAFEPEYHDLLVAGLSSTPHQQTDDTSARVDGQFWHTHVLCNSLYTLYSTRPRKDRLAVLSVLQNTNDLQFRFGDETLNWLQREFPNLPEKWRQQLAGLGDAVYSTAALKAVLDEWFGKRNPQLRTAIEHAAAIAYYRHQDAVPVVRTLVCDDASQFKQLTSKVALCWIHAGRHYEKLDPVVGRHREALAAFQDRFWNYYALLQEYRAGPTEELATYLEREFDALMSTRTDYAALDDRIARTAANRDELLTVLSEPSVPLHNNASELGARVSARRRDVSLHSRSERGARAMDVFTTIVQTAKKLGVSGYAYLRDRFRGTQALPPLAQTLLEAAAKAC